MPSDLDRLHEAITLLIPKLLTAMEAFEHVQRNMQPQGAGPLADFIQPFEGELRQAFESFEPLQFPEDLQHFQKMISSSATYALRACDGVLHHEEGFGRIMQAMRAHCRAQEHIYSLAPILSPVNKYFVETEARGNMALLQQLADGANNAEQGKAGVLNAQNEREQRGGFSLYIPENLDAEQPAPLVIVMHGGSGHGADFLWSWVREARTRGFILMSPTSQQATWSLMGEEHDLKPLLSMLDFVTEGWSVDHSHILLTGMSDGGTYSLLAGCHEDSPFTHLAPFSGVLHPDLVMNGQIQYASQKPIYLVHGTQDWMFPIETAYMARQQLSEVGADLTFREIDGLGHSFARAEIPALLTWFNPDLALSAR
ncbi:MAG: dienelactone hydrolase family protein [bacterium]|nr:phospholipase [Gammaproteobacteria bacterium]